MKTSQLLAAGALAAVMLTSPTAALAGPAPLVDPAIATPLSACGTHLRYVPAIGPAGGHYVTTCPHPPRWVSARGLGGGHYDVRLPSCMRYVPAIGPAGGHYVSTCPHQPRWVPGRGLEGGHYATATEIAVLSPTADRATAARPWGFNWGSAGVGAATMIGALAIALLAITGLRRRRVAGTGTLTTTAR